MIALGWRHPNAACLAVVLALLLASCRPNLEGAACGEDSDCPRSQYCEERVCREGARVPRPDAGRGGEDAGSDAGVPRCDVGAGCTVQLSAAPSDLTVGSESLLTVTVRDEAGAPVLGESVQWEVTGTGNELSADGGTTGGDGLLAVSLRTAVAGPRTVTASAGGRHARTQVRFLPGAPDAQRSRLEAVPSQLQVGRAAVLTLSVMDALGNPAPGVQVALAATGEGTSLGVSEGATDPLGHFTTTLASTRSGTRKVTATAGGASLEVEVEFTPGPAASLHSELSVAPARVAPVELATLSFTARDAWGNPSPHQPVALSATGSDNQLSATSGFTDDAGRFTVTLSSPRAERKVITALAGAALATAELEVLPGPPSAAHSSLTPTVGQWAAGAGTTLVLQLRDEHGNPVPAAQVVLAASGQDNALGATTGTTGPGGIFSTTFTSTRAEPKVLTATSGTSSLTASVLVVPGPVSASRSRLEAAAHSLVAGSGTSLVVTARDAFGNPVKGQPVALSSTGTDNLLGVPQGVTDGAGQFTTPFTSTRAEPKRLTAALGAVFVTDAVTFVPGPPSPARSSVSVSRRSGLPDANDPRTVSVEVHDALDNPVPGALVELSAYGGAEVEAPVAPTDPLGHAKGSVWSAVPCASTLTASAGGVQLGSVELAFLFPDAGRSVMTAPSSAAADGTPISVRVSVLDAAARPLPGVPVSLTYTGTATPQPASTLTGDDGSAAFTLASTVATSGVISAAAAGVPLEKTSFVSFGTALPLTGSVSGLSWSGLALSATGLPDASVAPGATSFSFSRGVQPGAPWQVAIRAQPRGGRCWLRHASGVAGSAAAQPPEVVCHADWKSVVLMDGATLALDAEGGLWSWGRNDVGQLGQGDFTDRTEPARLGTGFASLAAGASHALGVKADGTLWAWGRNDAGQLGVGDALAHPSPVLVGAGYASAAAGSAHSVALRKYGLGAQC